MFACETAKFEIQVDLQFGFSGTLHYTLKSSNEVKAFIFKSSIELEDLVEGDDDDNDNVDDLQQLHKCGPYFHVEKKYCTAGVLLDATNLNIVGMKFGKCHSMELAHVLPIQEIVARLHPKSQNNDHTDIQPRLIMEDTHRDIPTPPLRMYRISHNKCLYINQLLCCENDDE
ncbi:hypothetical protein FRX31_026846 [Thalictrum thalictroides]|uniref:Uncharacterized protein n=1 Tax=Thalictrum thalictroides TaxID=46969 RepID=A0A7J6VER2_THATH|nr:hypothetical protein FRX31_026846 [Thalictrum thalictroides]